MQTFDVYTSKGEYAGVEQTHFDIPWQEARRHVEAQRKLTPFVWYVPHGANPTGKIYWRGMARIDQIKIMRICLKRFVFIIPMFTLAAIGWLMRKIAQGCEWSGYKIDGWIVKLGDYINR